MAQESRPNADNIATYTTSDAGPYSRDQWAERIHLNVTGDPNTSGERTQLRGVVPTAWNKLVVTNPAGVTIRVASGAAWCNGTMLVHDPNVVPAAPLDFTPSTPAANRIDRVVVCLNNTNAVYNTNLEFPTTLTDYNGTQSIEPYSCRIVILTGVVGGAMRALVQTANYWMIELARYTISAVPAISGLADWREFAQIEHIVGSVDVDGMEDALIIGTELDDGTTIAGHGVAIHAQLEDDGGTRQDAGRLAWRWHTPTAGAEVSAIELRTEYITSEVLCGVVTAPQLASVDGNARGVGSVDFQGERSAAAQVASGAYSVLSGGYRSTSSGQFAVVGGGTTNTSSGTASTVAGGSTNTATADYAAIGGGLSNDASTSYATIAGGNDNTASGQFSTVTGGNASTASGSGAAVGGGSISTASGDYSVIAGGSGHTASADYSAVAGGRYAVSDKYGQLTHASSRFAADGDSQGTVQAVLSDVETFSDATWRELWLNGIGATQRLTIANDSAWTFHVLIVGTTQGGGAGMDTAGYTFEGVIENDNGATTIKVANQTVLFEDVATWDTRILNATCAANNALCIEVQDAGGGGAQVRWVATVRLAEVRFP